MDSFHPAYLNKIVNPDLARTALHHTETYGEFTAYVHLAKPDKCPSYMEVIKPQGPGFLKVRIPCSDIGRVADDGNVLSVELREHISSGGML